MCDKPWTQSGRYDGGILGFVDHAERFLRFERGFDVVQEGYGQRVALMKVRNVCVEARFGVLVGEEADVREFVAEDLEILCISSGRRRRVMKGILVVK